MILFTVKLTLQTNYKCEIRKCVLEIVTKILL